MLVTLTLCLYSISQILEARISSSFPVFPRKIKIFFQFSALLCISCKIILKLIHNNTKNWKKIFIFLGKTGKNELLQASKIWDIEYKQRMSVTNSDSIIIEINNLEKK